ncbi:MAG: hypothetical protein ABR573_03565 [Candidatus Dormibacteria bacterium]
MEADGVGELRSAGAAEVDGGCATADCVGAGADVVPGGGAVAWAAPVGEGCAERGGDGRSAGGGVLGWEPVTVIMPDMADPWTPHWYAYFPADLKTH